ncbi:anthranilate phosphoribosyltransferase [[Candida] jaroonii]|uniref:Anthranilate phosphoribosyltransferase n=1 Tax=[Candida] jaroonii TaxID=467808 RepID=A0ACA9YDW3_9ASCO|nr:anthranilate phosphoribosyltransferase [[Candida] jaroonii]
MEFGPTVLTPYIKSLLLEHNNLRPDDVSNVLKLIFRGFASDVQIAAFLTGLKFRQLDQNADYIAAAVNTIMEFSHPISIDSVPTDGYVDIVGTGGDGQNTFNVSTASSIVSAGMGIPVCKHGGKASTSSSGSGDLLKCLGVDLLKVNSETAVKVLSESKYTFLFAPAFHKVMEKVASVRKQLGVPTIFNILGPLINPAPLKARILGVYSRNLGEIYAQCVLQLAVNDPVHKRTMVVYGDIGLDEISPIGTTSCWIVENGKIYRQTISPKDFGLPESSLQSVKSGTPEENAIILNHILAQDNEEFLIHQDNEDNHPIVNYILMNSAALAVVSDHAKSYIEGVTLAKESIRSGEATKALESFKSCLNSL